jgi:glyoxylase-like metal-dependent hydrolase (beta-lactamase superfamily II)
MRLAPGLHRLGNGLVNSYLIEDGGGITIVDAGMPGQYGDLERELAAMGRTTADVRAIVLTHGDTDHVGYAARLHRETGIPVYVHTADAARARGEIKKPNSGWGPMKPGPFLGFLVFGLVMGCVLVFTIV